MENINYNYKQEVEKHIVDLKTLHEVIDLRHDAYYNHNIRLDEFKILKDFIWFDTCGNAFIRIKEDTYSPIKLPNENDICPLCGKGWNLRNLEDYFKVEDWQNDKSNFFHKQCNLLNNLNNQRQEFEEIFNNVYLMSELKFKAIPNQYSNWEGYAPWFIIYTPDGDIRIGWRKRVVQIEWLDNYKDFVEHFENEDVTKDFIKERFIHAWSIDKCVEYLLSAKNNIIE